MVSLNDGKFFHPNLDKDSAAAKLLEGEVEAGKFLFRSSKKGTVALSVVYRGQPTHHKVSSPNGQNIAINATQTECTNLTQLVEYLGQKHPFWPVPLTTGVPSGDGGGGAKSSKLKATTSGDGGNRPWFFPSVNKTKAEELLTNLGLTDGNFLVRGHKDPSKFIMSVVYKGNLTHHLVQATPEGVLLNNKPLGSAKTMDDLIPKLMNEDIRGWPIRLKKFPQNESQSSSQPVAEAPNPKPKLTPTQSEPPQSSTRPRAWYHVGVNKAQSEEILASVSVEDGTFLVRSHKDPSKFVLSVMYRGNPTHHLCAKTDEDGITVNGKTIPNATTMDDLIPMLMGSEKIKGWPIQLIKIAEAPLESPGGVGSNADNITPNAGNPPTRPPKEGLEPSSDDGSKDSAAGYLDVQAVPTKTKRDSIDSTTSSKAGIGIQGATFEVEMERDAKGGYGMTIVNNGFGNFVTNVKDGGVAAEAIFTQSLRPDAGLRISDINGINMMDCPKQVCTTLIKEANKLKVEFKIDKQGYFDTLYRMENPERSRPPSPEPVPPSATTQAQRPRRGTPFDEAEPDHVEEEKPTIDPTLPITTSDVFEGWEAETMFSAAESEILKDYDPSLFADSNVAGFVGDAAEDVCHSIMENKSPGSYIIRVVSQETKKSGASVGFEILVQSESGGLRTVPIVERADGRFASLQHVYYRLQDVMKVLVRSPFWIKTKKGKIEIKLTTPISPHRAAPAPTTTVEDSSVVVNPTFEERL